MNREFIDYDLNTAPVAARALLAENERKFGVIPKPLARMSASPVALEAALAALDAFERSSFAPLEREVLAMTMGRLNGCHFCVALHRRLLKLIDAPQAVCDALEAGAPLGVPRLEALRRFTLELVEQRGDVGDDAWRQFLA